MRIPSSQHLLPPQATHDMQLLLHSVRCSQQLLLSQLVLLLLLLLHAINCR
jgi:hypothetical protein